MYIGLRVQGLLFVSHFPTDFRKIHISNFMKIRPVGAELCHADERTEMKKPLVAFLKFANAPKPKE